MKIKTVSRRSMLGGLLASVVVVLTAVAGPTNAQSYPTKTVRIVVPFSPGALTDVIARIYAEELRQRWAQPVVVENRPGSGGVVASQVVLAAPADGYTLLFVSSAHAVNPSLFSKLPYNTMQDFSGVSLVAASPSVVVARPELGVKSLQELIALAKQRRGKMNYGSAGVGSATHLAGEYLLSHAKLDVAHIPYKGVQEAVTEVMAGRIDLAFPPIALAMQQMRAGKIVGLAVTSGERSPLMPDVPTVQEQGFPGFEYSIWYALVASSKTPRSILEQVSRDAELVTSKQDVRDKMIKQGLIPKTVSLGAFDAYIRSEIDKFGGIVKASGARID